MQDKKYLKKVREQYENYPYPYRESEEEKSRLITMGANNLNIINHYCFKGKMRLFPKGEGSSFRILVAGGGTGDAVIDFAEQLRDFNTTIVYLDMSKTSMEIAQERANIRKLDNIQWIHNSLLELPNMDLEPFDYINCIGVLHHLSLPLEGLLSLKSVLKPNGAMGLMLYALYGRMPIYQMQDLLRRINIDESNIQNEVDNAKEIIEKLPDRNWYKLSQNRWEFETSTDVGLYDLLLHTQDRAYSIPQLYEYIEQQGGMKIIEFMGRFNRRKIAYDPASYLPKGKLLDKIKKQSKEQQQSIAELLAGDMSKHSFQISYEGERSIASLDNLSLVPYFVTSALPNFILNNGQKYLNQTLKLTIKEQGFLEIKLSSYFIKFVKLIDGKRSLNDILNKIKGDNKKIFKIFKEEYIKMFRFDLILLKSKHFPKLLNNQQLQQRFQDNYLDNDNYPKFEI